MIYLEKDNLTCKEFNSSPYKFRRMGKVDGLLVFIQSIPPITLDTTYLNVIMVITDLCGRTIQVRYEGECDDDIIFSELSDFIKKI